MSEQSVRLGFVRDHDDAITPTRAYDHAAGYDLTIIASVDKQEIQLHEVGQIYTYDTGIIFEIPSGYHIEINERSGFNKSGYELANKTGIIDEDYKGHILIALYRRIHNNNYNNILKSDKAKGFQAILRKTIPSELVEITKNDLTNTARGDKGFGSSDIKPTLCIEKNNNDLF